MARRRGICPWTQMVLDPKFSESGLLAAKRKTKISFLKNDNDLTELY